MNAGKITVSIDTSSPSSEEYVSETDDVLLLVAKVDADQPANVETVRVYIHDDSTDMTELEFETRYESFRLYVNDTQLDSIDDVTANGTVGAGTDDYLEFDVNVELKDNDLIKVYVDLTKDAFAADELKVKIDNVGTSNGNSTSFRDVEYVSDGETVIQEKLTGTATSNKITIVDSADGVTIVRNDGYSNGEVFLAGEQGAKLIQFVVNAGTSSAIDVRRLNFDFDVTSSTYTNYTNLKLVVDGSQVGSTEDLSANTSPDGTVTIDDINYDIARNQQATFELYANIDTSTVADNVDVALDISDSLFYDDNDNEVDANAGVDVDSATLSIQENAQLSLEVDGDTPDEAIIVAGTTNVEVARYKLTAIDGEVSISDLYLKNVAANVSDARVSSYKLVLDGSVVDSRVPSNSKIHFILGSSNKINVAKDADVIIVIRADLNGITGADQTNKGIKLELTDVEAETKATSKDLTVVSVAGTDVDIDDGDHYTTSALAAEDLQSDNMYIRKTQPTLAAQDLGTSKLTAGQQTLYKVTISADSKADVYLAQIKFDVVESLSTATLAGYKLYVGGTEVLAADLNTLVGGATPEFRFASGTKWKVAAGSSKTIELKGTITGSLVTNDNVTVKIIEDAFHADANADTMATSVAAGDSNFIWSDNSGSPHTALTADWFNGYKVNGLDTTSTTLEN